MQDENKDFDLLVRSMLEDAGARPPRGIWKAISARLDGISKTRQAVWARWAGASLAFAAALGAGLFFKGTMGNGVPVPAPSHSPALASADVTEIRTDFAAAAALKDSPARLQHPDTGSSAIKKADSITHQEDDTAGSTIPETQAEKPYKKSGRWKKMEPSADPADLMAMADNGGTSRSGRLSVYAKGSIGGNDSDFRLARTHSVMAPGEKESGITELSTSTYGVPLTLGLGVRYYLLPRLSLGSGLDYSILTRTFTGKYSGVSSATGEEIKEAGNVSHILHYIGIPLGLYYDLLDMGRLIVYVYGLGEAEYCVASRYTLFSSPNIIRNEKVEKLQYSVGGGLGIEFSLSRTMGLYIDPGIRYYFPSDQPKSIRTDRPIMVNFDAGLRFNF